MTRTVRRLILIVLLSFFVAGGASYVLWRQGAIQSWLMTRAENAIVKTYNDNIRGHLPFDVERVEVRRTWGELLIGRINDVSVTLRKGDLRIHLRGPLSFPAINWATFKQLFRKLRGALPGSPAANERSDQEMQLDYYPIVHFEALRASDRAKVPTALSMHLWAGISGEIDELHEAGIELSAPRGESAWRWPAPGIEFQNPHLRLYWKKDAELHGELSANSFAFAHKTDVERNINVVKPDVSVQVPLKIQPFELGQNLEIQWKAQSGEALFGDRYFSVPEEPLHGKAELTLKDARWSGLKVTLGKAAGRRLHLHLVPSRTAAKMTFRLDSLSIKEALPSLLKSTANAGAPFSNLAFLQTMDFKDGKVAFSGEASIPLHGEKRPEFHDAKVRLEDVSFLWPEKQLAVKNLNLNLPYKAGKGIEGELSISRFGFRKLRGKLKSTWISLQEKARQYQVRFGEKGHQLPIDLDGLLLRIDSIAGSAQLAPFQYNLETAASLEPVEAAKILEPLCLRKSGSRPLPATLRLSLPKIELSPGTANLIGFARADLFGGSIQVDEMGIYDFLSEVPEFDFNLVMDGIDLHEIGTWVGFGEMDGTLLGYARKVVFQSWLPTQYDFEVKLKSKNHSDVVFSPDAMKNFARIFAEDGIDHIPGYAQWLAFGLPSRLLGGYDIGYAGIRVRSEDGFIRLETLDPPVEPDQLRSEEKHFILYGRRFKIPLKSSRYPLILDAAAMGNFVHRKLGYLESLSKNKQGETNEEDPATCIPSDLSRL